MSSFYAKSPTSILRNVKSADGTFSTTRSTKFLPDDVTASQTAAFASPRFHTKSQQSTKSSLEKSRLFEQISAKERLIEDAAKEQKQKLRTYQYITFEHASADRRGRGEYNINVNPRVDPAYKPPIRKMDVPVPRSYEQDFRRCAKAGPKEGRYQGRNPIIEGEHKGLVKPKNEEFTASVTSQVQNFKRFFLPSEWKAATRGQLGGAEPLTKNTLRPFPSIKALIQHDYVPQKNW